MRQQNDDRSDAEPAEDARAGHDGTNTAALSPEDPLSAACTSSSVAVAAPVVALAGARDRAASVDLDALYRRERGRVLATVRAVLGPGHDNDLEDVLQQVFIEVQRSLPRFEGRARLTTWLYRITVNVALQHIRGRRRRRWLVLAPTEDGQPDPIEAVDQQARLEDRQMLQLVYRAADRLSDKKRVVWVLHDIRGLTPQEIAQVVDAPMNTVRSRLLAARRELKQVLVEAGAAPGGRAR